ncbi:MAG: nucleoside 2-deoxyribosyltransferase [Solirubrobacterales bacterium]
MPSHLTVYLAGPAIFHPAAKALLDYLRETCSKHGLEAITPLDGTVSDVGEDAEALEQARAIRQANVDKIRVCDVVIACTSPFRGPGADAGTAWEMGYAEALGKPVIPWCEDTNQYLARVPHDRDDDGRVFCLQHGMLVEDFGLSDNLMLTAGIIPVQPDFETAVRLAASLRVHR